MTAALPPDPQQLDRLLTEALDVPAAARETWADRACGSDAVLCHALRRLLAAERDSAAWFEPRNGAPAPALAALTAWLRDDLDADPELPHADAAASEALVSTHVGPWRLLRRLGQGGAAVVWLAERDDGAHRQQAAVKLLRRLVVDADETRRLHAEREILATLEHPNIARLIDGGTTTEGQPWLATEFVAGNDITSHCRQAGLSNMRRLDLFCQVAAAVHHAHTKLVVHRDIKPSNVLVDAQGRARLLDFGIAKLLQDESRALQPPLTRSGHAPLTPEYAAPEQLEGGPVTTVTDVYQLGGLLFELLTDERPPTAGSVPALASAGALRNRSARDARALRGDLDTIVQTAMAPEPAQRYASADALAADVRRLLQGRPIAARTQTPWSLARSWARRSPAAATAMAASVLLLLGWSASVQLYAQALSRQRDTATAQAARTERAYTLLLDLFRRADPLEPDAVGGHDLQIRDALDASAAHIRQQLKDEPAPRLELLGLVARLYRNSGQPESARALLREVLQEQQRPGRSSAPAAQVATTLAELASVERDLGDAVNARTHLAQALAVVLALPPEQMAAAVPVLLMAGHAAIDTGSAPEALARFQAAATALNRAGTADDNAWIEARFGEGNAWLQLAQPSRAVTPITDALQRTEAVYGADHLRVAGPLSAMANLQRQLGEPEAGAANLRRALALMQPAYGVADTRVLSARNNLALALDEAGDPAAAQTILRELIALRSPHGANAGPNANGGDAVALAGVWQNLGASLAQSGDATGALAALARAQQLFDTALPARSPRRAFPHLTSARVHLQQHDAASARRAAERALTLLEASLPPSNPLLSVARCLQGEAMLLQGATNAGAALVTPAAEALRDAPATMESYAQRCRDVVAALSSTGASGN